MALRRAQRMPRFLGQIIKGVASTGIKEVWRSEPLQHKRFSRCRTAEKLRQEHGHRSRGEHGRRALELRQRPPPDLVHVLRTKLLGAQARGRREVRHAYEMNVVDLAVPLTHREDRGLGPDLRPDVMNRETDLLVELTRERVEPALAGFETTTGVRPEAVGQVEPGPVEVDEQDRVRLIDDEGAGTLSQIHVLRLCSPSRLRCSPPNTPTYQPANACAAMSRPIWRMSTVPLNSSRILPSPLNQRSSSASRSKAPAVSTDHACTFDHGKEV